MGMAVAVTATDGIVGLAVEAAGARRRLRSSLGSGDEAPPPVEVDGNGAPPVAVAARGEEEEEGEKRLGHYSSAQDILVVGDGDLSFSLALATAFGSGASLVATSLDTYEALKVKYSQAESNIAELKRLGATVLHGVDVKEMKLQCDLKNRRFDRIVFNLPHAGFTGKEDHVHVINSHRELVWGFFHNAVHLLRPYCEIHISHKTGYPYDKWDLERLAADASLVLVEKFPFRQEDYPGYNQKRGDGPKCDEPFDLCACLTFMFRKTGLENRYQLNGDMISSIPSLEMMAPATERGSSHLSPPAEAWPKALPDPGGIPLAMGRITYPDLLAPQEEPWYEHGRPSVDALRRDQRYLPWERAMKSGEYEVRGQVMPRAGAISLVQTAKLEHQWLQELRKKVGMYGTDDRCQSINTNKSKFSNIYRNSNIFIGR